jgi:hypothetical protein
MTSIRGISVTPEGELIIVDKKRKLNVPERPVRSLNKAKTIIPRLENKSILSFI